MEQVIAPDDQGLTKIRERTWARRVDDEHTHLLMFQPMKGGSVQILWGVCPSYVPYRLLPTVAWPRTLRQTRIELGSSSRRIWPTDRLPLYGEVGTFNGPVAVADDVRAIWEFVREHAEAFWQRTRTPEGVLTEAISQLDNTQFPFYRAGFVAACAAVRLGDTVAAVKYLQNTPMNADERAAAETLITDSPSQKR